VLAHYRAIIERPAGRARKTLLQKDLAT